MTAEFEITKKVQKIEVEVTFEVQEWEDYDDKLKSVIIPAEFKGYELVAVEQDAVISNKVGRAWLTFEK